MIALLFSLFACVDGGIVSLTECEVSTEPAIGAWTEPFLVDIAQGCDAQTNPSGWSIYDGRVDAVEGRLADLSFRKSASNQNADEGPSIDVSWWLLQAGDTAPDCTDVPVDPAVASGTWQQGQRELSLDAVAIWATDEEWELAPDGSTVHLYLATDGSDDPGTIRWWQRHVLSFTRSCPPTSG